MELVKEGRLTIPLFHGTSSLFVDSIYEKGLGGEDPVRELKVLPFLSSLREICEETLLDNPEWLAQRWVVEQIARQCNPAFRHGVSFLSPSHLTAVRYAVSNPLGSEIISIACKLYSLLTEYEPGHALDSRLAGSPVIAVFSSRPEPTLVEATNVNLAFLQGEQGQPAKDVIDSLENMATALDRRHFATVSQQSNFRLLHPLQSCHLRFYSIKTTNNDPVFPEYDLVALHPA